MFSTSFQVIPQSKIPHKIWESFCYEYPWCSKSYKLGTSPQSTILATLLVQMLDCSINWCQFEKLKLLVLKFKELSLDSKNVPDFVCSFFAKQLESLHVIIRRIQPNEGIRKINSQTEKTKLIKQILDDQKTYLFSLLEEQESIDMLANIVRGIALSVYFQKDFHTLAPLQPLLKKNTRESIIRSLMLGRQVVEKQDFFVIEDELLLPLSFSMQIPIYFFLNNFDVGGTTLTRRRIHAASEEMAISILIDYKETPGSIRLLSRHHSTVIIKNHCDFYNNTQYRSQIQQSQIPLTSQPTELIQCIQGLIEQSLTQTTIEYSKINELWIQKINEIINQGETQQLISKKQNIQLSFNLNASISELSYSLKSQNSQVQNQLQDSIQQMLQSAVLLFEKLVITQVTLVRDNLSQHISKLQSQQQKDNQHQKEPEKKIQDNQNIDHHASQPPHPAKHKILENKGTLFKKSNRDAPLSASTFMKQKSLSNHSRIEAKDTDQELPDPIENLTEQELDSEFLSEKPSAIIISEVPGSQISEGCLFKVEEHEYRTSDEEDSDKEILISLNKKDDQNVSSDSNLIHIEEDEPYDYQKIIVEPEIEQPVQKPQEYSKIKNYVSPQPKPITNEDDLNLDDSLVKEPETQVKQSQRVEKYKAKGFSKSMIPKPMKPLKQNENTKFNKQFEDIDTNTYNSQNRQSLQQFYIENMQVGRQSSRLNMHSSMRIGSVIQAQSYEQLQLQTAQSVRGPEKDKMNFIPNNSRRSVNIVNRMSRSSNPHLTSLDKTVQQSSQRGFVQMDQSKITEVDEMKGIDQSMILYEFVCPICYDTITNVLDIKTIHDDHRICVNCLESWIKVKFNSGQWNFKAFTCPIQKVENKTHQECDQLIEVEIIKSILNEDEFTKLCERAMQVGFIDIVCPWEDCGVNIRGMPPKHLEGIQCPECRNDICWVCKDKSHKGKLCPQRLEEIKGALQDERIGCCPECLEIYMKNEGCQHVQCLRCFIDFCFACSAQRDPIMNHGAHYHRVGCAYREPWIDSTTKKEIFTDEFEPEVCDICKKAKKACQRPLDLEAFKKLAHLNF